MSKIEKIKTLLSSLLEIERFGSTTAEDGTMIYWEGDEPKQDEKLYIENEDGEKVEAPEGEYKYETELGYYTIKVGAEGTITEVTLNEKEVQSEEEKAENGNSVQSEFEAKKEKMTASYREKEWAIYKAFEDSGVKGWVYECGDDFAILEEYDDDYEFVGFFRYSISVDENANVTIDKDSKVEVVQKWVEKDEKVIVEEKIEEPVEEFNAKDEIESLKAKIEEFEKLVANIKNEKPESVEVEFKKLKKETNATGAMRFTQYV
jgi:hypothetical protein